jgi:hypothetical protein
MFSLNLRGKGWLSRNIASSEAKSSINQRFMVRINSRTEIWKAAVVVRAQCQKNVIDGREVRGLEVRNAIQTLENTKIKAGHIKIMHQTDEL